MSRYSIVFACMLAGCTASPIGELGQQQCTDGVDNDHDGQTDCDDPDCQNTVCSIPMKPVAHGMDAGAGSGGTSAHPPPPADAGRPPMHDAAVVQVDEDDGGGKLPPIVEADASVACAPACTATEECVDGGCVPVAVSMSVEFRLTIDSVIASDTAAITTACYDADCALIEFAVCDPTCRIDPYVRVVRIRPDESTEEVGKTNVVSDDARPVFDGTPITVDLSEGDALGFELWDDNRDTPDMLLFACKPDLSDPKPGPLNCSPPESNPLRPLFVRATLLSL